MNSAFVSEQSSGREHREGFVQTGPVSDGSSTQPTVEEVAGLSISASCVSPSGASPCDTKSTEVRFAFDTNLMNWEETAAHRSYNNFDNVYFKAIVNMGEDAVPFILDKMKDGPTQLVHALDLIYPGRVVYNGAVSLRKACSVWTALLTRQQKN